MNRSILKAFLADQRKAKEIVSAKFGIPEDIRALEWSLRHCELRDAYNAAPFAEIFKPHGYGLELKIGDLYIDYDYSETGRADGFDAWRIFVYLIAGQFDNNGSDEQLSDRIDEWFRELIDSGYVIRGDKLYYINHVPRNLHDESLNRSGG
ncbi:MAG TPA: hypothetical protein VLA12_05050 [Planctomycetaceae bacterium]|nr:hypothetical protein [Planctomycetaceae bacterium]